MAEIEMVELPFYFEADLATQAGTSIPVAHSPTPTPLPGSFSE